MKTPFLASLIALALLNTPACNANWSVHPFTASETESKSFTTRGATRVVVDMFNGGIEVVAGTDAAVKVDVEKRGGGDTPEAAKADLKNVAVTMEQSGDTITVAAKRTDTQVDIGNSGASAVLRVPAGAVVELRTGNGKVSVSGPVGKATAVTSNGAIEAKGTSGPLNLTTSNGSIHVAGGAGQLALETSNGGIAIASDQVLVTARTSNGGISFSGSLAAGENSLRTSNSSIKLTLPAAAAFTLDAQTSNGKVTSEFPVKSMKSGDAALQGSVGENPQTRITLHTSNGGISIKQAK
jgi:DUF4097 and DUF4098 domain-containing protein YvlB